MKEVFYQYKNGPLKSIGLVLKETNGTVSIQMHKSRLPPRTFIKNKNGTYTAIGCSNEISFII
jgi:hypothetical protein